MLDIRTIREETEAVKAYLKARNNDFDVDKVLALDDERKKLLASVEEVKARRNAGSKEVGRIKAAGGDAAPVMEEMKKLGEQVKSDDARVAEIDEELRQLMLQIPTLPCPSARTRPKTWKCAAGARRVSSISSPKRIGTWLKPADCSISSADPAWPRAASPSSRDWERASSAPS